METQNVSLMPQRIESLDALRGLDLFFLVAFGPFARTLIKAADLPCLDGLYKQLSHVQWEGFAVWDLIMPLFLFMSGITIPFAFFIGTLNLLSPTGASAYGTPLKIIELTLDSPSNIPLVFN